MKLSQKETITLKTLQTQEEACIQKYNKNAKDAKDPVLKDLFQKLEKCEQKHYDTLGKVLDGNVPPSNCNCSSGKEYQPKATYQKGDNSKDKKADSFLATDSISVEKMVSSEYNNDVFTFGDTGVRKVLADIEIEEQNHAEMLYKYKMTNSMA